jgi:hypothetical protein
LPDAAAAGHFTHAQIAELAFNAAQRDAHGAQQALVKAGGVNTMVFIQGSASTDPATARFSQVDAILIAEVL